MDIVSYLVFSTISVILLFLFVCLVFFFEKKKKKTDKGKIKEKCSVTPHLPFLSAEAT